MNNVIFPGRTISPQGRVIYVASPIKAYILNYEWKKSQGGCLDLQNYFCKNTLKHRMLQTILTICGLKKMMARNPFTICSFSLSSISLVWAGKGLFKRELYNFRNMSSRLSGCAVKGDSCWFQVRYLNLWFNSDIELWFYTELFAVSQWLQCLKIRHFITQLCIHVIFILHRTTADNVQSCENSRLRCILTTSTGIKRVSWLNDHGYVKCSWWHN